MAENFKTSIVVFACVSMTMVCVILGSLPKRSNIFFSKLFYVAFDENSINHLDGCKRREMEKNKKKIANKKHKK